MNITIVTTVSIGYADLPFDVSVNVDYEQKGSQITVNDWIENECPFDKPPLWFYDQIQEAVEQYFYEQDGESVITFKNV